MPIATPKAIFRDPELLCPYADCTWRSKAASLKSRQDAYTRHYQNKHSISYKFVCEYCGAGATRSDSYNRHLQSCLGSQEANSSRRGPKPVFLQPAQPEAEDPAVTIQLLREEVAAKDQTIKNRDQTIKNLQSRLQVFELEQLPQELEETSGQSDEGTDQDPPSPSQSNLPSSPSVAEEVLGGVDLDFELSEAPEVHPMEPPACPSSTSQQKGLRRSTRQPSSSRLQAEEEDLCRRLRSNVDSGLSVTLIAGKGRGVVTSEFFPKNSFVVEYAGKLVDMPTSRKLHYEVYGEEEGSYMYWFNFKGTKWAIDATEESPRLGRLINHSHNQFNLITKLFELDGQPRLYFVARRDLSPGEELTFNYGDTDRRSVSNFPWLLQ